jgi:hypothetical protein
MLETQDILYIVLMFCALWFTAFACWLIFQVVSVVRRAHEVLAGLERKIDLLERSVSAIKTRFESGASLFGTVVNGLKSVVEAVRKERD